jgi:hypothetical protein
MLLVVLGPLTDTEVGVVMTRVALAADAMVSAVAPIKPKTSLRMQTPPQNEMPPHGDAEVRRLTMR